MSVQLAPRPKNEERRIAAVKRTGIIDSDQSENFSVFCEIAKALTNFDKVSFSLFDETFQCNISSTEVLNDAGNRKHERTEFNVCSYVLLSSEPTLIPDMTKHEHWKIHPKVLSGEGWMGYAGFPVINKDNYVFGTLCLLDPNIKKLDSQQIKLIEKLTKRLAHQLDIQTEQRELTAEKMIDAISIFKTKIPNISIEDFNYFVNICAGREIDKANCENLINNGLCSFNDNSSIELSEKGRNLQLEMGLQTRVLNKRKLEGETANKMVDNMLSELENL